MTDFKRNIKFLAFAVLLFLFSYLNVYAGSANVSLNGTSEIAVGKNIEIIVNVNNIQGAKAIQSFGGSLSFDSEYLQYVSYTKLSGFSSGVYSPSSKKLSLYSGMAIA